MKEKIEKVERTDLTRVTEGFLELRKQVCMPCMVLAEFKAIRTEEVKHWVGNIAMQSSSVILGCRGRIAGCPARRAWIPVLEDIDAFIVQTLEDVLETIDPDEKHVDARRRESLLRTFEDLSAEMRRLKKVCDIAAVREDSITGGIQRCFPAATISSRIRYDLKEEGRR